MLCAIEKQTLKIIELSVRKSRKSCGKLLIFLSNIRLTFYIIFVKFFVGLFYKREKPLVLFSLPEKSLYRFKRFIIIVFH